MDKTADEQDEQGDVNIVPDFDSHHGEQNVEHVRTGESLDHPPSHGQAINDNRRKNADEQRRDHFLRR